MRPPLKVFTSEHSFLAVQQVGSGCWSTNPAYDMSSDGQFCYAMQHTAGPLPVCAQHVLDSAYLAPSCLAAGISVIMTRPVQKCPRP